jgi:hypothetical protein
MDIGSILLILALLVFVTAFVLRPLQDNHAQVVSRQEHQVSALMAERDRLLDALLELDSDRELGKVPQEVYAGQRRDLVTRGAEVLRRLDQMAAQGGDDESRLEDKLVMRKAAMGVKGQPDDSLEKMIAARKKARSSSKKDGAHVCPNCGSKLLPGDRYCPQCGKALS